MGILLFEVIIEIIVFLLLVGIGVVIVKCYNKLHHRVLEPKEYLPEEELHSLKQVYYLIIMGLLFIDALYTLTFTSTDIFYFVIFDILLSVYVAVLLDKDTNFKKLLVVLLVPFGSFAYLMFGYTLIGFLDLLHIPVLFYIIKIYYDKFKEYTESNSLGITIILLFFIIFISFLNTNLLENGNPLDALVMVSNAFTSNGYSVLGSSIPGKLNSLFLVWSGYILSGVGTATLTAAILIKHFNKRLDKLENLIQKNNED